MNYDPNERYIKFDFLNLFGGQDQFSIRVKHTLSMILMSIILVWGYGGASSSETWSKLTEEGPGSFLASVGVFIAIPMLIVLVGFTLMEKIFGIFIGILVFSLGFVWHTYGFGFAGVYVCVASLFYGFVKVGSDNDNSYWSAFSKMAGLFIFWSALAIFFAHLADNKSISYPMATVCKDVDEMMYQEDRDLRDKYSPNGSYYYTPVYWSVYGDIYINNQLEKKEMHLGAFKCSSANTNVLYLQFKKELFKIGKSSTDAIIFLDTALDYVWKQKATVKNMHLYFNHEMNLEINSDYEKDELNYWKEKRRELIKKRRHEIGCW